MDMSSIAAAATSLKTAAEIAKAMSELKSFSDVQGKVIDLQREILSAQSSALAAQSEQFSMLDRIRKLEEEVARVKAWEAQKQRYSLQTPWVGAAVYALKQSMSGGEPAHWICTQCYESGKRSILQFGWGPASSGAYRCPSCESKVYLPGFTDPQPFQYAPD